LLLTTRNPELFIHESVLVGRDKRETTASIPHLHLTHRKPSLTTDSRYLLDRAGNLPIDQAGNNVVTAQAPRPLTKRNIPLTA